MPDIAPIPPVPEAGQDALTWAVARMLDIGEDGDAALEILASAARDALGADRASCYLLSDDAERVVSIHTTETDPERRAAVYTAVGRSHRRLPLYRLLDVEPDGLVVVEDCHRHPSVPPALAARLGVGAFIGVRMKHRSVGRGGEIPLLATLFVSFGRARRFSPAELATIRGLAAVGTLVLANSRLHRATLELLDDAETRAATDGLTGLVNHRTFHERLAAEVERARRHRRPLALAIIDLDHFKRVNDEHGHVIGDEVLREVAVRLGGHARRADTLARIGGEEFGWILPETGGDDAWQAVERARQDVARSPFPGAAAITISAGVCDLAHARDGADLQRFADGALYWAKHRGRDVVVRYSPDDSAALSDAERAERLSRGQALQGIRILARAVDARDPSTRMHSERVADVAVQLGVALGWPALRLALLREAGLVHDVGKIAVPDSILLSAGPLGEGDYERVRAHAAIGAEMVADVLTPEQVAWVRGHHERFDGMGYPDRLAGEAIPDGARVLALADAFDVMVTQRPYSEPMPLPAAVDECVRQGGAQFWPAAVDQLRELFAAGVLAGTYRGLREPAEAAPSGRARTPGASAGGRVA